MMRTILTGMFLAFGLAACSGGASGTSQMADCCKKAADAKAMVPKCCAEKGECCKATPKADCCKKAEAALAQVPDCCKKGEACCKTK